MKLVLTHFPRAAAPDRPKQGPATGHEVASSWLGEGRSLYPAIGVLS